MNELPASAPHARILRRLYLTLFLRGRTSRGMKSHGPRSIGGKLGLTLFFYAIAGCLALLMLGQSFFGFSLYLHGTAMFFVGMFVASSAGEVLFNKEEAEILLHRPVSPRAMLWAKVAVLSQVSLWLAFAFNLVPMLVGGFDHRVGLAFLPAHVATVVASTMFCTGSVVLVYQLCLKWFGRERLEGLMTFAQVVMTMLLVLGGQIAPQLARFLPSEVKLTGDSWWLVLLPPAWFAGMDEALMGKGTITSWILTAAGLLVTGMILALAFGKLATSYGSGLRSMGESGGQRRESHGRARSLQRLASLPVISWWLRDPLERSGFLLAGAYMLRDREVKLRLYPGVAPMVFMPVVFMLAVTRGGESGMGHLMVMVLAGYVALVPMTALNLLQFSQNWQAADVFLVTPTEGPGRLIIGARKAVGIFLVVPAVAILVGAAALITRDPGLLVALIPGVMALPVYARIGCFAIKGAPLSQPTEEAKGAKRGLVVFFGSLSVFAIGGIAAGAHAAGFYLPFLLVELVCVVAACLVMDRRVRALRWPSLEGDGL